jgi:PleD family two-component response regulator
MMDAIQKLVEINNQFYPGSPLSFSMGAATSQPGERLEATAKRADLVMFETKRKHYADAGQGPRREAASAA